MVWVYVICVSFLSYVSFLTYLTSLLTYLTSLLSNGVGVCDLRLFSELCFIIDIFNVSFDIFNVSFDMSKVTYPFISWMGLFGRDFTAHTLFLSFSPSLTLTRTHTETSFGMCVREEDMGGYDE